MPEKEVVVVAVPGPPKYVKSWPFMAVIMGSGLLFYILLGFM